MESLSCVPTFLSPPSLSGQPLLRLFPTEVLLDHLPATSLLGISLRPQDWVIPAGSLCLLGGLRAPSSSCANSARPPGPQQGISHASICQANATASSGPASSWSRWWHACCPLVWPLWPQWPASIPIISSREWGGRDRFIVGHVVCEVLIGQRSLETLAGTRMWKGANRVTLRCSRRAYTMPSAPLHVGWWRLRL